MGAARFSLIGPECVRIEWSPTGRFVDAPTLFAWYRSDENAPPDSSNGSIRIVEDSPTVKREDCVVETPRVRLRYRPDGRPPGESNLRAQIRMGSPHGTLRAASFHEWWPGLTNTGDLGGTLTTLDGLRVAAPLGPGLLSRDGWCLIDDSRGQLLVDGWVRAREWEDPNASPIDWYLFAYGHDFRAGLRALFRVSGPVPMPRRRVLGSWYSRYWPYSSADYREIVAEYEKHGFPLDVLVLDMDWHTGAARGEWTGWSWNRELLPDAEALLAWLHSRGLAVTLNLHPAQGVAAFEDRYEQFMRALGADPVSRHHEEFDAGNRPYVEALFREILGPLEAPANGATSPNNDAGVDFWWVDWQQDEFVRGIPGLTNLKWLNYLFFKHTASQPSTIGSGRRRGVSFSRWAGWGDHRHPIHFSGDAHTGWRMLAYQIPFTAAAGNVGCFYWSHDIGGHFGPRIEEATTRWVQFGAMSASIRLHSARSAALDRRPWTYRDCFSKSMRTAMSLRKRLMPYIYSAVRRCWDEGLPLLRPMYLEHSGQSLDESGDRAFRSPRQYMLGNDLLVAPIAAEGVGDRCVGTIGVWFPSEPNAGAQSPPRTPPDSSGWFDWFTGEHFDAGSEAVVAAAIDELPLFARAGVPIPMQPATQRMTTAPLRTLVVRIFPGAPGQIAERVLYEDDGDSDDYQRQSFCTTHLRATWAWVPQGLRLTLDIGPIRGSFDGMVTERSLVLEIAGAQRGSIQPLKVDGSPAAGRGARVVETATDDALPLISILLDPRPTSQPTRIEIEFDPIDPAAVRESVRQRRFEAALELPLPANLSARRSIFNAILSATDSAAQTRLLAIGAGVAALPDGTGPTASSAGEIDAFRIYDTMGWIDQGRVQMRIVDRVGGRDTTVSESTVIVGRKQGGNQTASVMLPVTALATPPLGLRATRLIIANCTIEDRPVEFSGEAGSKLRSLLAWRIVGSFDWDWRRGIAEQAHGPESEPCRLGDLSPAARYLGPDGSLTGWHTLGPSARGPKWDVDLRRILHGRGRLAYALTHIISAHPQSAMLRLDCSDKAEVWMNGAKVFTLDGWDTPDALAGGARIALLQGVNTLVIKVSEGGGGWGFTATLDGEREVTEWVESAEAPTPPSLSSG